jgi:hypothetical protein
VEKKVSGMCFNMDTVAVLHGVMLGVWLNSFISHCNRRWKTLQKQKTIAFFCGFVVAVKLPQQHKK